MNPPREDTLIGHLQALRRALIAALLIMAAGFIAGVCLSGRLLEFVFALPRSRGFSLYLFHLTDAVMLRLRVGALFGVLATSPLWVIPVFRFVAEGLSRRETNAMTALACLAGGCAACGTAACARLMAPLFFAKWCETLKGPVVLDASVYLTMWEVLCLGSGAVILILAGLPIVLAFRRRKAG